MIWPYNAEGECGLLTNGAQTNEPTMPTRRKFLCMKHMLETMQEPTPDALESLLSSERQLDLSTGDRMYQMASNAMRSPYMKMITERLGLTYAPLRSKDLEKWCESCPEGLLIPNLRLALQNGLLPCTIHFPWCNLPVLKWALEKEEFTFSVEFMHYCLEMPRMQGAYELAFANLNKLIGQAQGRSWEQKDVRAVIRMMELYMEGEFFSFVVDSWNRRARMQAAYLGTDVQLFDVHWAFLVHRKYRILKRMRQLRGVAKAIGPLCALQLRAAERVYVPGGTGYDLAEADFNASGAQTHDDDQMSECTKRRKL